MSYKVKTRMRVATGIYRLCRWISAYSVQSGACLHTWYSCGNRRLRVHGPYVHRRNGAATSWTLPCTLVDLICPEQTVEDLASAANMLSDELTTGIGPRCRRLYVQC